jgi:hypothetical protein
MSRPKQVIFRCPISMAKAWVILPFLKEGADLYGHHYRKNSLSELGIG